MTMDLERLPTEILSCICEYVEAGHKSSLFKLALLNSQWREVAMKVAVRSIEIKCDGRLNTKLECGTWLSFLKRTGLVSSVQEVEVVGAIDRTRSSSELSTERPVPSAFEEVFGHEISSDSEVLTADHVATEAEHKAFDPIYALAEHMSGLTDLRWSVTSQVPPSLLAVLERRGPHCRLHVSHFRLRSVNEESMDLHEMALIQSPCLFSIAWKFVWQMSDGRPDYNFDAVSEVVTRFAPNLREIRLPHCRPAASTNFDVDAGRLPFKGLPSSYNHPNRRAALSKVHLVGRTSITFKEDVQNWLLMTDFDRVVELIFGERIIPEAVEFLLENPTLPALERLTFGSLRDRTYDHQQYMSERQDEIESEIRDLEKRFLTSVPRLKTLVLRCLLSRGALRPILSHHSSRLEVLTLGYKQQDWFDPHRSWPYLRRLTIAVNRDDGSAREVQAYREIASLPNLVVLLLTLNCSQSDASTRSQAGQVPPFWTEFEKSTAKVGYGYQICNGFLMRALRCSAVDEDLVRAIWKVMVAAKAMTGGQLLRELRVYTQGGNDVGGYGYMAGFTQMISHISRSWLLDCSPRNDSNEILIKELGKEARVARRKIQAFQTTALERQIFHKVWQIPEDKSNVWHGQWRSFPLDLE